MGFFDNDDARIHLAGQQRRVRGTVTAIFALALVLGWAGAGSAQPVGSLSQLPRPDACTQVGGDGINCRDGIGMDGAIGIAISPDAKSVYVTGLFSNAIAVFSRDPASGALTQLAGPSGCVAENGDGITCQDALGLFGPSAVTVSPDNKHVYVASYASGIAVFSRNLVTGALTQLPAPDGCISPSGGGSSDCTDAYGDVWPNDLLISPDGNYLYTTSLNNDSMGVYARNQATGKLTQLPAPEGCVALNGDGVTCKSAVALEGARGLSISKNGKHIYVASADSNAVAIFKRDKNTGALTQRPAPEGCIANNGDGVTCLAATNLDRPMDALVGKNGKHVYVVSWNSDTLTAFTRNPQTGALTQLPGKDGCHDESGDGVTCTDAVALNAPYALTESNNGRHIYVTSVDSGGVAAFRRNKTTGALEQLYYPNACTIETGDNVLCRPGLAVGNPRGIAVTKNGKHVYLTSYGYDGVAAFLRKR